MAEQLLAQVAEEDKIFVNVLLSHNPCPDCVACNGLEMTLAEWEASEWGLPTSSGRVCEDDCHCLLVDTGMLADLPAIGDQINLRGDPETDIRKIVDIGPNEESLKSLMEEWYNLGNQKIPPEIYDMPYDEIEAYMKKLLTKHRAALGDVQV
jgi:hypothetical protein